MTTLSTLDISYVRSQFPVLKNEKQVFFDNAGGTQCLGSVIDSVRDYLTATNVQLGGSYDASQKSTALYNEGVRAAARYLGVEESEIVIGPSTTQLFRNVSIALKTSPGDEIILSKVDHEANVAPWLQLAKWKNLTLKWWVPADLLNPVLDVASLKPLLSEKTRLVACTHTSNVLGTIHDIKSIADAVHSANSNALLCVDGVAFAPHRPLDLKALNVDFYSFSWYKVYGPHIAVLYAKKSAQQHHLESLGHYFKPPEDGLENMLGLAASNYELTASIPRIISYLKSKEVGGWEGIVGQEERLQEILLSYLRGKEEKGEVRIFGERSADPKKRVSVVSFTVKGKSSRGVVDGVEKKSNFGARDGHFYAKRLLDEVLGVDSEDGIVRVSLVHYNTEEEVRGFVKILDQVLSS